MLEEELALLMNFDVELLKKQKEEIEEEEETEQPLVPGENRQGLFGTHKVHIHENLDDFNGKSVKEWLDFDYKQYLDDIIASTRADPFTDLLGTTQQDFDRGKLNKSQIAQLKEILENAFRNNKNLIDISEGIQQKVKPSDLISEKGKLILSADNRPMNIARSESTRMASLGAEKNFKDKGVEKYAWVASVGARTCPVCDSLHGRTFNVGAGLSKPPAHPNCRCTIVPVIPPTE